MQKLLLGCLFLVFAFQNTASAQTISIKKLKKHVSFLADDKLKGRGTGTPEEKMAADYLAKQFKKIGLQPIGDGGSFFQHFSFHKSLDPHGTVDPNGPLTESQNVVGFLDNGAATTIVVGAHFDHLGLGHDHNSLDANPEGKIHNGADDNASGTAAVVEMARYFAKNGQKERHNFLFCLFSGEELGLIGSKKLTESTLFDWSKMDFMVNLDMVGRLNPAKKTLVVGGVGTSPTWVPLLNELPHPDFSIKQDSSGIGPSDHTSFYLKNRPVLFVFTGQHSDYHKPSDDVSTLNFEGEKQVVEWLIRLLETVDARSREPLVFQETKASKEDTPSFKVTLGIMPDYTFEGVGLHVDGVTGGKPASRAGLKKDDIILKLGEIDVKNIQDYMKALSKFKKGDSTQVVVKRGAEEKTMPVSF